MKKYIFTNYDQTWSAEYWVDGMANSDNQTICAIKSKSVEGAVNTTDLAPAMVVLGLPDKVGTRFTEVEWVALATAKNLNLTKYHEQDAPVVKGTALNTAAELLTFSFLDGPNAALSADVVGVVDSEAGTIDLTVPALTVVTALKATFTKSTGSAVAVGVTPQVSGTTANDFTSPVEYVVTSAHGETKTWTVTVTIAA